MATRKNMDPAEAKTFVRDQLWEAMNVVGYSCRGELVIAPKRVCALVNYIQRKWIASLSPANPGTPAEDCVTPPVCLDCGNGLVDSDPSGGRCLPCSVADRAKKLGTITVHPDGISLSDPRRPPC